MKGFLFPEWEQVAQTAGLLRKALFVDNSKQQQLIELLSEQLLRVCTQEETEKISDAFQKELPVIHRMLQKDLMAAFDADPAAQSMEEVILSYPGFFAVSVYRFAHFLYQYDVPFLPRMMTEYAHSVTGIDIHPGAQIGSCFFMDHGTGIVIGETTVIGDHVKLYQGVTLGAISTKEGQRLKGMKRHPTIEDGVTIYAGASILGGDTVIGRNSVIGANAFVVTSVPANAVVLVRHPELLSR